MNHRRYYELYKKSFVPVFQRSIPLFAIDNIFKELLANTGNMQIFKKKSICVSKIRGF